MDMLTIFVALTAIAILLQAGLLLGMYLTMRKSTERMEALASEVRNSNAGVSLASILSSCSAIGNASIRSPTVSNRNLAIPVIPAAMHRMCRT